jgi:hypothetical protein
MRKKITVERVCIVNTVYCLLLYFLYTSEKEIKQTYFFVGKTLSLLLKDKHFDYHCFNHKKKGILRILFKIHLNFFSHIRWRFLKTANIFGQDHIQFFSGLVKNRNYTLIEDSPLFFSSLQNNGGTHKRIKNFWKNIIKLLYGKVFWERFGKSNQCKDIILTQESDVNFLNNKTVALINLEEIWKNSSKSKQELILSLFNLDLANPIFFCQKNIIVFTQPFYVDVPNFSEQEQIELYKEIVEQYDKNDVIIKVHPRDKINYQKHFSDIEIFDKPVPMQLLSILGVRFKKAVTIFSSSVLDFPYKIEIIKIGTSCRKKLENHFGII